MPLTSFIALSCVGLLTQKPSLGQLEAKALPWIRANVKPFESDVPSPAELQPVIDMAKDSQVIAIGEPTHGDHQSQMFKSIAIRELVQQQVVDTLFFELNREAGVKMNDFVNEGKGDISTVLTKSGIFSIWQTDDLANLLSWLQGYVKATKRKVKIYGIDCQDVLNDLKLALVPLRKSDKKLVTETERVFAKMFESEKKGETLFAWIKATPSSEFKTMELTAQKVIDALRKMPKESEALYAAEVALQELYSYEYDFGTGAKNPTSVPTEYWARRDVNMGKNLLRRLGDSKGVLWAHDSHVISQLPPETPKGYQVLGSYVRNRIGDKYRSIGFAWHSGAFHAKKFKGASPDLVAAQKQTPERISLRCDQPYALGRFFNLVGPSRFFLDLRNPPEEVKNWGKTPYLRGYAGWGLDPAFWHKNPFTDALEVIGIHDAIVFYREISPSTLWKLPK